MVIAERISDASVLLYARNRSDAIWCHRRRDGALAA